MAQALTLFFIFLVASPAIAWDLSRHSIPTEEIRSGGPPRDGIPALLDPRFVSAAEASFLRAEDRVLGFAHGREARAYPIRILSWHELVNDTVDGVAVLIGW